jgi:type III restriction enzyme
VRHWELDSQGQPTQEIIESRRIAKFITPIPKPRKRKEPKQQQIVFDEGEGLSTEQQQYDPTPIINELRYYVDQWRSLPNTIDWQVTPETARLLQHWRHHEFNDIRPFFCQIEAVETAIWLTEVAPNIGKTGKKFLDHLVNASTTPQAQLST